MQNVNSQSSNLLEMFKNNQLSDTWQSGTYSFPDGSWEGYISFEDSSITSFSIPTYIRLNNRKILYLLATQ